MARWDRASAEGFLGSRPDCRSWPDPIELCSSPRTWFPSRPKTLREVALHLRGASLFSDPVRAATYPAPKAAACRGRKTKMWLAYQAGLYDKGRVLGGTAALRQPFGSEGLHFFWH